MTYHRQHICKCQLPACICPNNWAHCKYCGVDITWVKTELGRSVPINGHLRIFEFDRAHHVAHQITCTCRPAPKPRQARPKKRVETKARKPVNPRQGNIFADLALTELNQLRASQSERK